MKEQELVIFREEFRKFVKENKNDIDNETIF